MMSDLFHTILELLSFTELFFFCLIACITLIHSIICIRKTNFENTLATEIGMGFLLIFISFLWKYLPFYFLFFFALFFLYLISVPVLFEILLPLSLPSLHTRIFKEFFTREKLTWKCYRNTLRIQIHMHLSHVYV